MLDKFRTRKPAPPRPAPARGLKDLGENGRRFYDELVEAERLSNERNAAAKRAGAAQHATWTASNMAEAEEGIASVEASAARDRNPIGRARREAERAVAIAELRRDLAEWSDEHEQALAKARTLGVAAA